MINFDIEAINKMFQNNFVLCLMSLCLGVVICYFALSNTKMDELNIRIVHLEKELDECQEKQKSEIVHLEKELDRNQKNCKSEIDSLQRRIDHLNKDLENCQEQYKSEQQESNRFGSQTSKLKNEIRQLKLQIDSYHPQKEKWEEAKSIYQKIQDLQAKRIRLKKNGRDIEDVTSQIQELNKMLQSLLN
jgi:chromosome segregation ATPase